MIQGAWSFVWMVDPGCDYFQDKETVFRHTRINDLVLEIGVALGDEPCTDAGAGHRGQLKLIELIDPCPGRSRTPLHLQPTLPWGC
jgi:hypothetical protein